MMTEMMTGSGGMFFGGGFMWIFWILIFIGIVWAVKVATGSSSGTGTSQNSEDSPLDILKKRYARGEIDEAEFDHRRRELERD